MHSDLNLNMGERDTINIKTYKRAKNVLLTGVSAVSLFVASAGISAQDSAPKTADPKAEEAKAPQPIIFDEIVFQGIRKSLTNAQNLKRDAPTFVDAITASDIGALPDRSVSETLQRVPGINILRFNGANDPDHFAVEGAGVTIRGLPFVRPELNGRDGLGANAGSDLGFEDISPELLGSISVYKNQSADLIEGGISGTIDLRTRLPFDQDGQLISFSAEANYGDVAQVLTPSGSFLYSNNWDTSIGRVGLLANASFTRLRSRAEATQLANFVPFGDTGNQFVPTGGGIRTQDFDRERQATAFAAQWESPDEASKATFQFLRTDSSLVWGENVLETGVDGSGDVNAFDATDFVFDDDGILESGTITDNSQWRGPNATGALFAPEGGQQIGVTRERNSQDITSDFAFNFKHSFTNSLRINLDAQYATSEADVADLSVFTSIFSPIRIDRSGGGVPTVSFVIPDGERANYFQDFSNHFLRAMADQLVENDAEVVSFRADVEYDFSGDGFFKSVKTGVRYADQDTTLLRSDLNWGAISEVWTSRDVGGQSGGNFDDIVSVLLLADNSNPALNTLVDGLFGAANFNDFQRNTVGDLGLNGPIPTYIGPLTDDFASFSATRDQIITALGGAIDTRGFCGSAFSSLGSRVCSNGDQFIAGTPFINSERANLSRETFAAYARFDFSADIGGDGVYLEGNVGLRVVHTERVVETALISPGFDGFFPNFDQCPADVNAPANGDVGSVPGVCSADLGSVEQVLGANGPTLSSASSGYTEFLPSLNLSLDLTEGHLLRFAISRTLARPNLSQLNERPVISLSPDNRITNANGVEVNSFGGFTASPSGNARILPQTAIGIDLSYEWYFADTGSVTATIFNKVIENLTVDDVATVGAASDQPLIVNGSEVEFGTQNNGDVSARVRGFEIAYQQFYDFLPEPFNGFGTQINYTYIDEDGEPFNGGSPRFAADQGLIAGISEHTVNAALLFEKGPWQARAAYNWRSEFLITPQDVIFPNASIFQPSTGQLDFSVFYNINENWKVGIQGVNILDDVTETTQSINEDSLRAPRSFFRNDRRFTLVARATF